MNNKFFDFINLHNGEEDKQKVLENVASNVSFKGANLWILACAIIIASIGLNVNSTAVIIGAMLISPLMSPIVGAGFALGTFDFALLRKSIKNLLIATLVSLMVSAIYFYISPFKEVQSELLARTAPNIYDVLIAFFGGLVGVIALTRVEKGNPIPGVAIATALMPPLCTAGYGLATGNMAFFAGAFYLYIINCFFICIATFFVVKYLDYPPISFKGIRFVKQIKWGITAIVAIMIIPSFYLAFRLFKEKQFTNQVESFIQSEFLNNGYTVIYKKLNYNSNPKKVDLAFLNKKLSEQEIVHYNKLFNAKGLPATQFTFRQDEGDLKSEILNEINKRNANVSEKDVLINNLKQELAQYKVDQPALIKEVKLLFPDFKDVAFAKIERVVSADSSRIDWVMLYSQNSPAKTIEKTKLKNWLKERLQISDITLWNEALAE